MEMDSQLLETLVPSREEAGLQQLENGENYCIVNGVNETV